MRDDRSTVNRERRMRPQSDFVEACEMNFGAEDQRLYRTVAGVASDFETEKLQISVDSRDVGGFSGVFDAACPG